MLIEGLNLIRDFWDTLNDAAEVGTGTTQETAQDTDLETPIAGSESTETTSTKVNQSLLKEVNFPGTSAGGESVTEMIWKDASPEKAGSRVTFSAVTWQTDRDIIVDTEWVWRGRKE